MGRNAACLHPADRGSQYTYGDDQARCALHPITSGMSRVPLAAASAMTMYDWKAFSMTRDQTCAAPVSPFRPACLPRRFDATPPCDPCHFSSCPCNPCSYIPNVLGKVSRVYAPTRFVRVLHPLLYPVLPSRLSAHAA